MLGILTEMTWSEIKERAQGGATVVLPTGSIEQHGPHLPVKTDSLLVDSVAYAAATKAAEAVDLLIAPILSVGASHHHKPFFAISVSEETYIDVLCEIAASVDEAGFDRLFILNGHGGNTAPLRVALPKIRRSNPKILVGTADYWAVAAAAIRSLRISDPGGAAHAGELETSLVLHLEPGAVRDVDAELSVPNLPDGFEIDLVDGGAITTNLPWRTLSAGGHLGDPGAASAQSGGKYFEAIVEACAAAFVSFHGVGR